MPRAAGSRKNACQNRGACTKFGTYRCSKEDMTDVMRQKYVSSKSATDLACCPTHCVSVQKLLERAVAQVQPLLLKRKWKVRLVRVTIKWLLILLCILLSRIAALSSFFFRLFVWLIENTYYLTNKQEFFPKSQNLLGLNVNAGQKILIRCLFHYNLQNMIFMLYKCCCNLSMLKHNVPQCDHGRRAAFIRLSLSLARYCTSYAIM